MSSGSLTLEDVARKAGVSVSTVSRALRGDPRISPSTRSRVEAEAARLAYNKPPRAAGADSQTHAANLVKKLGIVTESAHLRSFYSDVFAELARLGQVQGFRVNEHVGDSNQTLLELTAQAKAGGVDGVIFCTRNHLTPKGVQELQELGVPMVFINRYVEDLTYAVTLDDYATGLLAARFLTELGHRRIAYLSGPYTASTLRDRAVGFRTGLELVGCYAPELFVTHNEGTVLEWTRVATVELLSLPERPTAIWTHCDVSAAVAVVTARAVGLQVPEDVSIMGFDHAPNLVENNLTTFDHRFHDQARQALGLLNSVLAGVVTEPMRICIMPRLVPGITTGKAPAKRAVATLKEN